MIDISKYILNSSHVSIGYNYVGESENFVDIKFVSTKSNISTTIYIAESIDLHHIVRQYDLDDKIFSLDDFILLYILKKKFYKIILYALWPTKPNNSLALNIFKQSDVNKNKYPLNQTRLATYKEYQHFKVLKKYNFN